MKKKTPEELEKQAKMLELLKLYDVQNMPDIHNLFKETIAMFLQNGLEAELEDELGYAKHDVAKKQTKNSRNGHSKKTVKSSYGKMEIATPRDRNGEFEPTILKKNQVSITEDIETKIVSMYAKGMSTSDIEYHIKDIYGLEISDSTVSRITDKMMPAVLEWQNRPLEEIYAVVFIDAIYYHVRSEGHIVKKAVYIVLGYDLDGKRDVLGMYVGETESAKYWATVLNNLQNRGVKDIFITCSDGLTGLDNAIASVFPKTEHQTCIIHQLRYSLKFVPYKDRKALVADLKRVYGAIDETSALAALQDFKQKWDCKYPKISKSWEANWASLSTYFKYTEPVRRMIYTTNAIESLNSQLKKVTKSKSVFPTDESVLKMLYLATMDITKKWTGVRHDWKSIALQLEIFFEDRFPLN